MDLPVDYTLISQPERRAVREEYIKLQNGYCAFCNELLAEKPSQEVQDRPINWDLFPPNFLRYPIHLQHCHDTGMTEGAVHALCNAHMWQYYGR